MSHLYNLLNNINRNNGGNNILSLIYQAKQMQNNPGQVLDILLYNNKIDQQQYNELQQYKNNPWQVFNYLMNHGNSNELNQAQQTADQYRGQF